MSGAEIVIIPLEKYTELIRTKERVDVLVERLWHDDALSREDILWILGTDLSVELAAEEQDKRLRMGVVKNEN